MGTKWKFSHFVRTQPRTTICSNLIAIIVIFRKIINRSNFYLKALQVVVTEDLEVKIASVNNFPENNNNSYEVRTDGGTWLSTNEMGELPYKFYVINLSSDDITVKWVHYS